jgi:hypothetical protein
MAACVSARISEMGAPLQSSTRQNSVFGLIYGPDKALTLGGVEMLTAAVKLLKDS